MKRTHSKNFHSNLRECERPYSYLSEAKGWLFVAFVLLMMFSCRYTGTPGDSNASPYGNLKVVVIDSCEYLQNSRTSFESYSITHKGNCSNPIHKQQ